MTTPDGGGAGNGTQNEDAEAQRMLAEATRTFTQDDVDRIVRDRLARERAGIDELRAKASKYDELEQASKTEQEKALERAAKAEREAAEARTELLRHRVAASAGLPPEMAARLRGSTEEELTADAGELQKLLGAPASSPTDGQRPQERLTPVPLEGGGANIDMNDWMRQRASRS
jgi:ribosomal protein S24E